MDAPTVQPLPGADRIRALTDTDAKFKAFDSYPWKKDPTFMFGLKSILGPPPPPPRTSSSSSTATATATGTISPPSGAPPESASSSSAAAGPVPVSRPQDMAIRARIFYYTQRVGVTLSFDEYVAWLAAHPSHTPPDILPDEYKASPSYSPQPSTGAADPSQSTLAWQAAAPKTSLWVDKGAGQDGSTAAEGAAAGEAPYPSTFQHIVELIASGKPVPGIKEIPNTVVQDPNITPFGKMTRPRKPWEKDVPSQELEENNVGRSFPPIH